MRNLKRALSLGLTAAMISGLMVMGSSAASYADVTSEDNQEAIEVLQAVGVMVGDENGDFNPDQKVTRNEMAVVMANLMEYNVATYSGTSPFTDVPSWAEPYVAACWTNGITAGTSATTYGGSDNVTTAQAALMLMKALGYFQYESDFGSDWQLAAVAQGNRISLFDDVDSGVREAMTRNDLAQLVLNTLEAGTVEASTDSTITVGDVSIVTGVEYNYITSGRSYATAIDNLRTYTSDAGTGGSDGYIVELGEKLYNGDLKKDTAADDFGRPSNVWTYKSSEIGKYADDAVATWTTKVSERDLYQAVGSAAYDNYDWTIYQNGYERYADGNGHEARDAAISHSKTSGERVLIADKGVLTQVFVDDETEDVVLTMIETGVGEVTRVTEDGDQYEVTVSMKTKVNNGRGSAYTPSSTFVTDQAFERGDIVVYTASVSSGEIESLAVAETVSGVVTEVKDSDYVYLDGTQYSYNYSYTKTNGASDYVISNGIYNLDDSKIDNPAIDKDATLYLDAYGYVVAFEGETNTPEDYLYVVELGEVFKSEPSAKVVFYDGTEATINIDKVIDGSNTYDAISEGPADSGEYLVEAGKVYKFTAGSSSYDLEVVDVEEGTDATIKKDTPTITATGDANGVRTNNSTVFVDVENNKTWTGYGNVSSKTGATVDVVMDGNVAMIVFISGNFSTTPDDDDYIILTGTGIAAVRIDGKTVYRLTSAYDINGERLNDVYQLSNTAPSTKGLYLITSRDGDDYIRSMTLKTALTGNSVVGVNADTYAVSADDGLLVLNKDITFGTGNSAVDRDTFAIDSDTTYIVVTQTSSGDVDTISVGSLSDIEAQETGAGADNTDMTGVYVMTVDDATDDAPVAESVLVIVPYTGSTIGGGQPVNPTGYVATISAGRVNVTYTGAAATEITRSDVENTVYNALLDANYDFNSWGGSWGTEIDAAIDAMTDGETVATGLTIVGYDSNDRPVTLSINVTFNDTDAE